MPHIFSYGTLQQARVQLSTFGRLLQGQADELVGFERSLVRIEDPHSAETIGMTHYDNVTFHGRSDSRVTGAVFEVTDSELLLADRYEETAGYKRISVVLASGRTAWLYLCPSEPEA